ncbi:DedA family protein [Ammonicoccus fulvus]|uniref:DedA family protein n=1 Tax=Ammonicoccus fulvus TaxID=3138240 RepID=A0ABZ3FPT1_9ACTN
MTDERREPDHGEPETLPDSTRVPDPETPDAEPEWWQDPRMPWGHKPTRADMACFWVLTLLGLYSLALLPFRAALLTKPFLAAVLTGSRTGVVMIGALAAVGQAPIWPFWVAVATLSVMKFDLVYFWAGRRWGRGVFEMIAGKSPRARRNAERAERLALKYSIPALFITYLPIPLPAAVIYATLGAARMSWKKFIAFDLLFAAIMQSLYFYLGYRIGAPAVEVVAEYGKYLWYLSIVIIIGMIVTWWWNSQKKKRADHS